MKPFSKVLELFKQDPPSIFDSRKEQISLIIYTAVFTSLFLLIFQPYGVNNYDPTHSLNSELIVGVVLFGIGTGISLFLFEFFIAPFLFKRKSWFTIIIKILSEIVFVASTLFLLYNYMGNFHDWHLNSYLGFVRDVFLMALVPLSLIFLQLNYKRTKKKYDSLLAKTKMSNKEIKLLNIGNENSKNKLLVDTENLIFIEAKDNYVLLGLNENGSLKKELLRSTLKSIEDEFKSTSLIRCHRSYMVNLNKVIKTKGEGHKMILILESNHLKIPVSRSYVEKVKQALAIYHK